MPKTPVDLLVVNAGALVTLAGPARPRIGAEHSNLGIVDGGAVAVKKGLVVAVGPTAEIRARFSAKSTIDAKGALVTPGLVDPHTHLVFMGSRENEFEMRAAGKSYQDIAQAGGGIHATVEKVRAATRDELVKAGRPRVRAMLEHGTTTVEAKSGYGLSVGDEVKSLEAIRELGCVPTFLGAHEVPHGMARADYVREVAEVMVPRVRGLARHCDVFCEVGVFSVDDARMILSAAKAAGMTLKMHAEEFRATGGAELAAELGAVSADHLMAVTDRGIRALRRSGTVAVLLPGTSFFLGGGRYAPARRIIEEGVPIALGTDFNPGSCTAFSLPLILSLACTHLGMSPAEALAAATINAAFACGEGERAGSLEPGKRADLVVWHAKDYREIPYWLGANLVGRVIRAGKLEVDRRAS
jgi:imidazolonepropionase